MVAVSRAWRASLIRCTQLADNEGLLNIVYHGWSFQTWGWSDALAPLGSFERVWQSARCCTSSRKHGVCPEQSTAAYSWNRTPVPNPFQPWRSSGLDQHPGPYCRAQTLPDVVRCSCLSSYSGYIPPQREPHGKADPCRLQAPFL